ncbi:zinc finger protein ZFP2-like [Ochlerotatus camptorhynchus]|uniref:zinc finger protein ZFP2-like n=1 Tax=Ochlerotatus camptorhynchus TaxID=644619 RepID=UPI0031D9588D
MDVCRTCMNKRGSELVGDDFHSIFSLVEEENVYIADCLAQWVGQTIDENDGMPSEVCQPCLEAIKSIAVFIDNAKECDSKLRIWLVPDKSQDEMLACADMDIKIEPEEISTDVLSERASDEEQSTKQEDADTSSIDSEEEETPKRRKRTSKRRRKASLKSMDMLDEKEQETFNIIEVQDKMICCGCYLLFDNEAELKLHGKTVHEETKRRNNPVNHSKNVVCKICYKRFERDSQRQGHRERYESIERVYECKKCNKHIVNSGSRYKHAHNHPEWNVATPRMYLVPMSRLEKYGYLCCVRNCTSSHTSEDSLLEHIKKDHNLNRNDRALSPSGDLQCPFCLRFFESKAKLAGHYINRYGSVSYQREYQCHECGKVYSSLSLLRAHENKHAEVKPHECDVCFKRFYSEAVLKQHKLIHTQSKTLACSICGMTFRTKMFLVNHYRVHSDDKPFVCDVCHKPFRHSSSLFTHKKIHNPNMQYKCSECGKGFTDTANLKRHMVSHTGIKPYQCNFCDKRFMRLTERSEHESTVHLGVMPYACEVCGKQFSAKRTFQKHQQACGLQLF